MRPFPSLDPYLDTHLSEFDDLLDYSLGLHLQRNPPRESIKTNPSWSLRWQTSSLQAASPRRATLRSTALRFADVCKTLNPGSPVLLIPNRGQKNVATFSGI